MGRGGSFSGTGQTQVVVGDDGGNADMRNVELLRKGKRYTLNLYDVMFKGDADQNVIVDGGDIVTVPELPVFGERVYVLGEVTTQGIYRLKDASDLLASLSLAGGPTTSGRQIGHQDHPRSIRSARMPPSSCRPAMTTSPSRGTSPRTCL